MIERILALLLLFGFVAGYVCTIVFLIRHLIIEGKKEINKQPEVKREENWFSGFWLIILFLLNPLLAIIYILICSAEKK